ncbi:hypothetical protein J2S34_000368 [Nitrobacter winogradskyi]|uniref:Uncharacterized protein n=1 Tax=Nitrobacter winogradskyi TaxID=913 RepID=A0ACC6AEA6_NITWI|nr:hypothetical protein [Nitrobacter winogradskyi]MCP1997946.1 hypothetical protein [Nitrobacter winogradskyi]
MSADYDSNKEYGASWPGFVPAIHAFLLRGCMMWIPGTRLAMTKGKNVDDFR